jgi:leader peptidase (prepilin peptidase) / N-methyltransferase
MTTAASRPDYKDLLSLQAVTPLAAAYSLLALPAALELAMPRSAIVASVGLGAALVVLSVIDLKTFRLPDVLTLPLILAGIALAGILGWDTFGWRAASAALGFGSAYAVAQIYQAVRGRNGLGLGDAKLFAASGAWVGGGGLASVVLYACAAALIALLVARLRKANLSMTTAIPFGPFLAAGTWLVWLYGPLA